MVDSAGNVYLADIVRRKIFKVTFGATTTVTTVAGTGTGDYSGDGGPAAGAALNSPLGLAFDGSDNLFVADITNHRVRRVDTSGSRGTS